MNLMNSTPFHMSISLISQGCHVWSQFQGWTCPTLSQDLFYSIQITSLASCHPRNGCQNWVHPTWWLIQLIKAPLFFYFYLFICLFTDSFFLPNSFTVGRVLKIILGKSRSQWVYKSRSVPYCLRISLLYWIQRKWNLSILANTWMG